MGRLLQLIWAYSRHLEQEECQFKFYLLCILLSYFFHSKILGPITSIPAGALRVVIQLDDLPEWATMV